MWSNTGTGGLAAGSECSCITVGWGHGGDEQGAEFSRACIPVKLLNEK